MSVELQRSENATQSLRRIVREQISGAITALDRRPLTDVTVHTARRQLTKARATLRLLRPALGARYKREDATMRDVARPLSIVRDGRVLIDTLDKLSGRHGPPARATKSEALRRILVRDRVSVRKRILKLPSALKPQRDALEKLRKRAARWKIGEGDWEIPGAGLKRVYGDGRTAFEEALADGSNENFHAWRKQVKYLWHQLQILEPLRPGPIGELADQAHKLADYLGDDHDLFVLREKVTTHRKAFTTAATQGALLAQIDRCRAQLQEKAAILGRRLYEERPTAFEKRFRKYWHAWQREREKD
jgi:CHAD domain-containing protein